MPNFPAVFDNLPSVAAGQSITAEYQNLQSGSVNNIESAVGLNPRRELCEGRLTLVSNLPVPTYNTTSSFLYFTPFLGNRIGLYDGSIWNVLAFSQVSIELAGLTGNTIYDVFAYSSSGTPVLELTAWTDDRNRATALVLQDGIYVKSGAATRRYLGSIRTTDSTHTEDSKNRRLVWNYNNRVERPFEVVDATASWTYGTYAWRPWDNSTSNRVEFVVGVAETLVQLRFYAAAESSTSGDLGTVGIGLDSTTSTAPQVSVGIEVSAASRALPLLAEYGDYPTIGYHYLQLLEQANSTSGAITFFGGPTSGWQSGAKGAISA